MLDIESSVITSSPPVAAIISNTPKSKRSIFFISAKVEFSLSELCCPMFPDVENFSLKSEALFL